MDHLGVLRLYGFQVFTFESCSNSGFAPRVLPIHRLLMQISDVLSYPLSMLPQPQWLPYSWFFTTLLFAANSLIWGTLFGLLIYFSTGLAAAAPANRQPSPRSAKS